MSVRSSACCRHSHSAGIHSAAALAVVPEAAHSSDCTGEAAVRTAGPDSMRPEAAEAVGRLRSSRRLGREKPLRQVMASLVKQTSRDDGCRRRKRNNNQQSLGQLMK
jgi:hypothetical protein